MFRYRLLGKTFIAQKIQNYFIEVVNTNSRNILIAHVLLTEKNRQRPEELRKYIFIKKHISLPICVCVVDVCVCGVCVCV